MNDRRTIELEEGWATMQVRTRHATRARAPCEGAIRLGTLVSAAARVCAAAAPRRSALLLRCAR